MHGCCNAVEAGREGAAPSEVRTALPADTDYDHMYWNDWICYAEVLQWQPSHFDALHLLGVIAHQTRRTEQGVELIKRVLLEHHLHGIRREHDSSTRQSFAMSFYREGRSANQALAEDVTGPELGEIVQILEHDKSSLLNSLLPSSFTSKNPSPSFCRGFTARAYR
jgi:hypothetical protein